MGRKYEPLNDFELGLLEYLYQDIELPVIELLLQPSQMTQKLPIWDKEKSQYTQRPTLLLAAAVADKPSDSLKAMFQTDGKVIIKGTTLSVETQLDDAWKLNLEIKGDIPVERIRLGKIPAFQNAKKAERWAVCLEMFNGDACREFLEQPLFIQLSNGYKVKCFLPFA